MEHDVDVADDDTESLRLVVLDPVRGFPPLDGLERVVWGGHNLDTLAHRLQFVLEHVVGYTDDEAFLQVRPGVIRLLAQELLCDVGRVGSVLLACEGDDHGLISAVALEHIDTVEAQAASIRQRLKGRKASERFGSDVDTIDETHDKVDTVAQSGQVERRALAVALHNVRKETGRGGRKRVNFFLVVDKLRAEHISIVPLFLLLRETGIAGCSSATLTGNPLTSHSLEQPGLIDERDLDHRLPVLLLSIHVELKVSRVEIDDGRSLLIHEILRVSADRRSRLTLYAGGTCS